MEHDSLLASPNDDNNGRKQQKGSTTPLLVVVSTAILLLGLVFYGGDYLGSPRALGVGSTDAHLRHGEMVMTNAAAALSLSTSLVGSGTAASDLKTLTIAVDDDKLIDGLLSGWLPKGGGNAGDDVIPIGDSCPADGRVTDTNLNNNCATPPGLDHGVCLGWYSSRENTRDIYCQTGQPGAFCDDTFDCVKPPGLDHPVCRKPDKSDYHTCQSGTSGADCGQTFDCVIPTGLNHAVCRNNKCQS